MKKITLLSAVIITTMLGCKTLPDQPVQHTNSTIMPRIVTNSAIMPQAPSTSKKVSRRGMNLRATPVTNGITTISWNLFVGSNFTYHVYTSPYALTTTSTSAGMPVFDGNNTNMYLAWSGQGNIASVAIPVSNHVAVTTIGGSLESPPSNEIIIGGAAAPPPLTNKVTTVQAAVSSNITGPWTNTGPVLFTGTNVVGKQYWQLIISTKLQ
jgi:hypothetical protein